MSRVLALVEGRTELAVLNRIVVPHLGLQGVDLRCRVIGKPGHKGGVRRGFESVIREIRALILHRKPVK